MSHGVNQELLDKSEKQLIRMNQFWYDQPSQNELIKNFDFERKNKPMILDLKPEFGIELALGVPYAYSLHSRGLLESVRTSIEMKPFYYFCENVEEYYTKRTVDNEAAGLYSLPNSWIHHNAIALTGVDYSLLSPEDQISVNGVLDYREWICPPYKEYYRSTEDDLRTVVITNKYNIEHGERPQGFFDIDCLRNMFDMLIEKGYRIIYKRTRNTEKHFAYDENEVQSINQGFTNIVAMDRTVKVVRELTDFGLVEAYKKLGVTTMDYEVDMLRSSKNDPLMRYNEAQLRIMADCTHYISVCGGNSILSALFGGTLITYVHKGKELREGYFGENSYIRKLSNANVIPVLDPIPQGGTNNYSGIYDAIENNF